MNGDGRGENCGRFGVGMILLLRFGAGDGDEGVSETFRFARLLVIKSSLGDGGFDEE